MIIEAFGKQKSVMDWLEDIRIHPEVTRDVLVKRVKRGDMPENALTTPIIKGARKGDTKMRINARKDKMTHRVKMFKIAQRVRSEYENGVAIEDIMDRHSISKSQVNKMASKMEWYNVHWVKSKTPEEYVKYLTKSEKEIDLDLNNDKRIGV